MICVAPMERDGQAIHKRWVSGLRLIATDFRWLCQPFHPVRILRSAIATSGFRAPDERILVLFVGLGLTISLDERFRSMNPLQSARCAFSRLLMVTSLALASLTFALPLHAQKTPAPAPPGTDIIVFTNGDQLTGKLLHGIGDKVTFHSDVAGDVTVTWEKVKSIHTSQKFAVIQEGQHVNRKTADADVVQGAVQVEDDQVKVAASTGATQDIPVKKAQYVIDQPTYTKELHGNPGWGYGWSGSITAGATLVEATQNSRNFTGGAALARTIPTADWLDPRNRTLFDFTGAYGNVTQPGTVGTRTNIIHFDAEHDWYFTPRLYFLVGASFDHNYSQGLQLQQTYGGGIGYTVIKSPLQELDVKFDVHYERQSFFITPNIEPPPPLSPGKNLIGADFGDTYMLNLPHGLVFDQGAKITPAFNQSNAWSALGSAGLLFPVYKRFGFSIGTLDNFLNDPAAGSKKNSFQFTAGVTYTLK